MVDSHAIVSRRIRAMTLLELLVALAVMLTLTALVLPSLRGTLGERAFDAAIDGVRSQALMARAHAQRTGSSVELRYESDPPRLVATLFDPSAQSESDTDRQGASPVDREEAAPISAIDDAGRIGESWASCLLGDGITLAESDPRAARSLSASAGTNDAAGEAARAGDAAASGGGGGGAGDSGRAAGPIRLAIFLPDGSAILQSKFWIVDAEDRAAVVTINPWLGRPSVQREAPSTVVMSEPEPEDAGSRTAAVGKTSAAPGDDESDDGGSEKAQR